MGLRINNFGTRAQIQHLFDVNVPFLMAHVAIDISTKVISNMPIPAWRSRSPTQYFPSSAPQNTRSVSSTFFSFDNHCLQVASNINNVWKALAGTNWGKQNETLLITCKTLGRSNANYSAPVWSTNASRVKHQKDTTRSELSIKDHHRHT